MSMISELVERLRRYARFSKTNTPSWSEAMTQAADTIEELSAKLSASQMERSSQYYNGGWIPVEERMPEEYDSVWAKNYGTDKWSDSMWRTQSDYVTVTIEYGTTGTRVIDTMQARDGEWHPPTKITTPEFKVIAWMPILIPYKPYMEVRDEKS